MPKRKHEVQRVAFVRAREEEQSSVADWGKKKSRQSEDHSESGSEVKAFYEDVVGLNEDSPSSSSAADHPLPNLPDARHELTDKYSPRNINNSEGSTGGCSSKSKPFGLTVRDYNAFLKAAQTGDVKCISTYMDLGVEANFQDVHGWSALMCASHAGHVDIVKMLLSRGVNTLLCDKKGRTAYELAQRKRHHGILDLFDGTYQDNSMEIINIAHPTFYCEICQTDVQNSSVTSHESSTSHLFKMNISPKPAMYMIPESNKGFQMMLRSGWNQDRGLGPEGEGSKYPVKTVLKRDRYGLGVPNDSRPKVTHFTANDKTAVKRDILNERLLRKSTLSKLEKSKKERKDKIKERNFREQFYMD